MTDDGGPAFPRTANDSDRRSDIYSEVGMSLRDYFAGMALMGSIAFPIPGQEKIPENAAKWAYVYADAMLKAREAKP